MDTSLFVPGTGQTAAQFASYYNDAKVKSLHDAFDRVANKANWKYAIDTIIPIADADDRELIAEAIIFMTGSVARFTAVIPGKRYRVQAAGYYVAVGA